jgi:hypothetical protein
MSESKETEAPDPKPAWAPPRLWSFDLAEAEFGFNPTTPGDAGFAGCS